MGAFHEGLMQAQPQGGGGFEIMPFIQTPQRYIISLPSGTLFSELSFDILCGYPAAGPSNVKMYSFLNEQEEEIVGCAGYTYPYYSAYGSNYYNWSTSFGSTNSCVRISYENKSIKYYRNSGVLAATMTYAKSLDVAVKEISIGSGIYVGTKTTFERFILRKNGVIIADIKPIKIGETCFLFDAVSTNKIEATNVYSEYGGVPRQYQGEFVA